MIEVWKIIVDYPDYEVSNLGRIRSLKFGKKKLLNPGINKYGYINVNLCKNGEAKNHKVHRLVAQAFIPNPSNYPEVNHKDENKQNNCVDNLEWCTSQYNHDYSQSKQVGQFDLSGNLIKVWKSVSEIERQLGFDQGLISRCCLGNKSYYTAYGYLWRYI